MLAINVPFADPEPDPHGAACVAHLVLGVLKMPYLQGEERHVRLTRIAGSGMQ